MAPWWRRLLRNELGALPTDHLCDFNITALACWYPVSYMWNVLYLATFVFSVCTKKIVTFYDICVFLFVHVAHNSPPFGMEGIVLFRLFQGWWLMMMISTILLCDTNGRKTQEYNKWKQWNPVFSLRKMLHQYLV